MTPPAQIAPPYIHAERLAACVATLDPASRALLDLSLHRRIRDEEMARVVRIDPFNLAWRRARAIERVATQLGYSEPGAIGAVRSALSALPDEAWLRPPPSPPAVALAPRPASPPAPVRPVAPAAPTAATRGPSGMRAVLLAGAGALLGAALSRRRRRRR